MKLHKAAVLLPLLIVSLLLWGLLVPWLVVDHASSARQQLDASLGSTAQQLAERWYVSASGVVELCTAADFLDRDYPDGIHIKIINKNCEPEVVYDDFPVAWQRAPAPGASYQHFDNSRFRVYHLQGSQLQITVAQPLQSQWLQMTGFLLGWLLLVMAVVASSAGLWRLFNRPRPSLDMPSLAVLSPLASSEDLGLLARLTGEHSFAGAEVASPAQINQRLLDTLQQNGLAGLLELDTVEHVDSAVAAPADVLLRALLHLCLYMDESQAGPTRLQLRLIRPQRGIGWQIETSTDSGALLAPTREKPIALALMQALAIRFAGDFSMQQLADGRLRAQLILPLMPTTQQDQQIV